MERENLFCMNLDDEDAIIDHEEFILRRVSADTAAKGKAIREEVASFVFKGISKGFWLQCVALGALALAVLCLVRTVLGFIETGTLPLAFALLTLAFGFAAGVLYTVRRKQSAKNEEKLDQGLASFDGEYDCYVREVKHELTIPEGTVAAEVFTRMYSKDMPEADAPYTPDTVELFAEDGKLCLFYGDAVLAVPLSAIDAVVRVEKSITFDAWNKEIRHDKGDYLQYKISFEETKDGEERYSMTGYYSLRFTHGGAPFEILVPLYEIKPFLELVALTPTEE